jgi:curved DNA-binding protein CbpA
MPLSPSTYHTVLLKVTNADNHRAHRKLALKHDPKRVPNDPTAPERWAAITKAYETLKDPERKKFYDLQGRVPADLEDFDISSLHIGDE